MVKGVYLVKKILRIAAAPIPIVLLPISSIVNVRPGIQSWLSSIKKEQARRIPKNQKDLEWEEKILARMSATRQYQTLWKNISNAQ
jgi:hypothetical protein